MINRWKISLVVTQYLKFAESDPQQEPSSSHCVTVKELLSIAGEDEVELEPFSAVLYVSWVMRDNTL
jgi:hypothetical protein